jgi:uncharacterized protein YuzE
MDAQQAKVANFQYDSQTDVMYLSFGEPQEALGEEVEPGVVIRVHPQTGEVVGITISDFAGRFRQQPLLALSVPLKQPAHA